MHGEANDPGDETACHYDQLVYMASRDQRPVQVDVTSRTSDCAAGHVVQADWIGYLPPGWPGDVQDR